MNPCRIAEALLASGADAIVATDRDGIIRHRNPGAERIFGHSAAEAIGRRRSSAQAPERAPPPRDPTDNLPLCTRNMFGNISRFLILKPREGIHGNST